MSYGDSTDMLRAKAGIVKDAEKIRERARAAVNKPQKERADALRDIVDLATDLLFHTRTVYPEYWS